MSDSSSYCHIRDGISPKYRIEKKLKSRGWYVIWNDYILFMIKNFASIITKSLTNLFPSRNILLDKLLPSGRLRIEKLQAGLKGLSQVITGLLHEQLVLEILICNSWGKGSLVLLSRNLDEGGLLASNTRENVDNLLGSVVRRSGQNLLVLQLTGVLEGNLGEKACEGSVSYLLRKDRRTENNIPVSWAASKRGNLALLLTG
jgi:hypothetical protein